MTTALHLLGCLLAVLLGLVALILLTPFRLRLEGESDTGRGWIGGYLGVPLGLLGMKVMLAQDASRYALCVLGFSVWRRPISFEKLRFGKKREGDESRPKKKADGKKEKQRNGAFVLSDVVYLMHIPGVGVVARRLFGLLNPVGELEGRVGLDDPTATGWLAAALGLWRAVFPSVGQDIQLNFTEAELEGRFKLGLTLWIPQIVVGAGMIALSRDGRRLIAHLWGLRKRRLARVA